MNNTDDTLKDFSIILIGTDHLLRAGIGSLLSKYGCRVERSGGDFSSIDWSNKNNLDKSIFLMIDSQNTKKPIFSNIETLFNLNKNVKIIVISGYNNGNYLEKCFHSGAVGYILMSSSEEVLIDCIKLVRLGQNVFPSEFVNWMSHHTNGDSDVTDRWARPVSMSGLTESECKILQMLATGLSNKGIGSNLNVPHTSVKVILKRISKKIGASNRVQAAVWAVMNGLGSYENEEHLNENQELTDDVFPNFQPFKN